MGEVQPAPQNLTELIPFTEPQSHSTPQHSLQVHEESDQVTDPDGIKHSFNQSMEPASINVSALLESSGFAVPQDNLVSQPFDGFGETSGAYSYGGV